MSLGLDNPLVQLLVLAGSVASSRGAAPFAVVRLHSNEQADGRLISGTAKLGALSAPGGALAGSEFGLACYHPDGRLDTSFGGRGPARSNIGDAGATPVALAAQSDSKIVAGGRPLSQVPTGLTIDPLAIVAALAAAACVAAGGGCSDCSTGTST